MMARYRRPILFCVLAVALQWGPRALFAQLTNVYSPWLVHMKAWGTMRGGIQECVSSALSEGFGRSIVALGDIDGDYLCDFLIGRIRCDTTQFIPWRNTSGEYAPIDLLLYRGQRGHLPSWSDGERIGSPEVLAANVQYLAHGDWDGDGWVDLAVSYDDYTDSSTARPIGVLFRVVVVWGQPGGWFDFSDTTRLVSDGSDLWRYVTNGATYDANRDGVPDLALSDARIYVDSASRRLAPVVVFAGGHGERWGRNGTPRDPTWRWWAASVHEFSWIEVVDQDCDGFPDLVGHLTTLGAPTGFVSVLYGSEGGYPDTTEAESIDLGSANGKMCSITDVTGDGVPELCMNTGKPETIKIFLGRPGQRLRAQYGTGADPPAPDSGRPWARPWAEIWLPDRVDAGFPNAGQMMITPGDLDLDGIDDLCAMTYPYMICYTTSRGMDSLVDADLQARYGALVVRLGDIDGSGQPSFALQGENEVAFFKGSANIVQSHADTRNPFHAKDFRCEHAAGVTTHETPERALGYLSVHVQPNPASDRVTIAWTSVPEPATISVVDGAGREVLVDHVPGGRGTHTLDTRRIGRGAFLVIVRTSALAGSASLVIP